MKYKVDARYTARYMPRTASPDEMMHITRQLILFYAGDNVFIDASACNMPGLPRRFNTADLTEIQSDESRR